MLIFIREGEESLLGLNLLPDKGKGVGGGGGGG